MTTFKPFPILLGFVLLFCFAKPALAFGAGNIASISKIEGQNWRHGDIEDALLKIIAARALGGKRFDKLNVARVYFGNWLRDYSQAVDVGTVKSVSAEAIRLALSILGFLTFGYGSKEFEVTAERLGCYRPEEHIDNPKNYADNVDARQYDPRLRGPVDEEVELAIDEETGMKNYIANEKIGITTSAQLVRDLFTRCIELGRSSAYNKDDLYEALRLLGTGLHCLEDFFAHSNYTELALIELGEQDVFPHVGRNTKLRIPGARRSVYPLVTGTFGGVDFLHSVTGEVSDKMIQSELEDLEGTLINSQKADTSFLRELLDKIPDGILGGKSDKHKVDELQENAQAAQMENLTVSPKEPEELTNHVRQVFRQIMPAIEFHDELLKDLSQKISQVPILPKILEQLEEQLSLFVFQIIAPFVLPVLQQIKNELATGATEIIESSKNEQHIVFEDDDCSDPTHSMLSKDHFTNILNEIAGRAASKTVAWIVPQIMEAWDDDSIDVDALLNKIIYGVLHHPAQRNMGPDGAEEGRQLIFECVKEWWEDMSERQREDYRRRLSREGVESGENHREGEHDSGHGCGGKLKMHKNFKNEAPETMEDKVAGAAATAIFSGVKQSVSNTVQGVAQGKTAQESASQGFGGFFDNFKNSFKSALKEQGVGPGGLSSVLSGFAGKKEEQQQSYGYGGSSSGGYGGSSSSYGRKDDDDERPSYGGGYGSGYGGSSGGYGGYGRRDDDEERPSYGGGGRYGRRRDDEEEEDEGSHSGYGRHHGYGY
ncbi:hypothetical protein VTJ04DRAFT_3244 [Mycothermus thermophilus]|uniref:uncharacterized protein n=1 Tax=Humicola insolens TaxID=85995 RepID=UPI003743E584